MIVLDFRISSIWLEPVPDLISKGGPGPLGSIAVRGQYEEWFDALFSGQPNRIITLPWPFRNPRELPATSRFWNRYVFEAMRNHPWKRKGSIAWAAAVPFKAVGAPARLVLAKNSPRIFCEVFFWPYGLGLVVTAWFRGTFNAADLINAVSAFRTDRHEVSWPDGTNARMQLTHFGAACLDRQRKEALGIAQAGNRAGPLDLLTLVKTDAMAGPPPSRAELISLLQAARTAISGKKSKKDALRVFAENLVVEANPGRVIWDPSSFVQNTHRIHTLGCFHRNLTQATLQVKSLAGALRLILDEIAAYQPRMPPNLQTCAETVAGLSGRIYGGKDTYRHPAIPPLLEQGNALHKLRTLRKKMGLTEPLVKAE